MASRYWVGGTNTWDTTTISNWSTTSGGAPGASVPTSSDDVFINASSGTGTVTYFATTAGRSLNFTGFTGTFAGNAAISLGDPTGVAGAGNVAIKVVSTMTYSASSAITFVGTCPTAQTVDLAGKVLNAAVTFNGVGGNWSLASALDAGNGSNITLTAGTLTTNNFNLHCALFGSGGSATRVFNPGSSTITCTNNLSAFNVAAGITFGANTALLVLTGTRVTTAFGGANVNGLSLSFTSTGTTSSRIGSAGAMPTGIKDVSVTASTQSPSVQVPGDLTISGTFTVSPVAGATSRTAIQGTAGNGVRSTISAASVSIGTATFNEITGAGLANWDFSAANDIGDAGGNTGITFSPSRTLYKLSSGLWGDATGWSQTSGGSSTGARVPLAHDDVVLDSNTGSGTVTVTMVFAMRSLDASGFTGTLTSNVAWSCLGSMTLGAGMAAVAGQGVTLGGRANHTLTSNGISFGTGVTVTIGSATSGTYYTLADNFTCLGAVTHSGGTFDTAGRDMSVNTFTSNNSTLTRSLYLRSSTIATFGWTLVTTALTFDPGTSTILISPGTGTRTFAGGDATYYNLVYNGAGSTGTLSITGNNTFNKITFKDGTSVRTLQFAASSTTHVSNFDVAGVSGALLNVKAASGTCTLVYDATGKPPGVDYINCTGLIGSPANTWYVGTHSTLVSGNTEIYLLAGPSVLSGIAAPSADSTLAIGATVTTSGVVAASAASSLTVDTVVAREALASFAAAASLTTAAAVAREAMVVLAGAASLAALGDLTRAGTAVLAAASSMTVDGLLSRNGVAALSAVSTLTARAVQFGSVALVGTSSLTVAPVITVTVTASLSGSSSLAVSGALVRQGDATLTADSTMTPVGVRNSAGAAVLSADSSVTVSPKVVEVSAVALVAAGSLSAPAVVTSFVGASLSATATLSASGVRTQFGLVNLAAASSLSGSADLTLLSATALAATSSLSAAGARVQVGVCTLSAVSSMTSVGFNTDVTAVALIAQSTLTPNSFGTSVAAAALAAASMLTSDGVRTTFGGAALVASSSSSIAAVRTTYGIAGLTASSSLDVGALVVDEATALLAATTALSVGSIVETSGTASLVATSMLLAVEIITTYAAVAFASDSFLVANATAFPATIRIRHTRSLGPIFGPPSSTRVSPDQRPHGVKPSQGDGDDVTRMFRG